MGCCWPFLSVLAAVPVISDAATAAKFAQKGVKAAKMAKKAENVNKVTDISKGKVTSLTEFKSAKTKKDINNSDNVYSFPDKKHASTELSKNKVVQKQDNVVRIDKYERKVEKQVNGPDKITVTKKIDTIVAMDNSRRVEPVHKARYAGSSSSYGAGQNNGNTNYSQGENRKNNRIKILKEKTKGQLSELERKELKELDSFRGSLFD